MCVYTYVYYGLHIFSDLQLRHSNDPSRDKITGQLLRRGFGGVGWGHSVAQKRQAQRKWPEQQTEAGDSSKSHIHLGLPHPPIKWGPRVSRHRYPPLWEVFFPGGS